MPRTKVGPLSPLKIFTLKMATPYIQGDLDVFSINQNLNSLHQGDHRFSHAFFTKVLHFRDNRKCVQF